MKSKNVLRMDLGVLLANESFSKSYLQLHKEIMSGGNLQESRNGNTMEVLDFKTILEDPIKRCVGGNGRNINIFFLIAEALWIFSGRKDVRFLTMFNSQMKQFSDDGETFHAPYGYRLRNYGLTSHEEQKYGLDQISISLHMLAQNPMDRRVVCSIWNPSLDLNTISKDLPCNDMFMLKLRDGRLHGTIANRSNDLHLGLPTNIFQFSFVLNMMASILGVKVGTQVHNSQSLHIYNDGLFNNVANKFNSIQKDDELDMYETVSGFEINVPFSEGLDIQEKINMVDFYTNNVIHNIEKFDHNCEEGIEEELQPFTAVAPTLDFRFMYELMLTYIKFKNDKAPNRHLSAILNLIAIYKDSTYNGKHFNSDLFLLSFNFIYNLCKDEKQIDAINLEIELANLPTNFAKLIGKL